MGDLAADVPGDRGREGADGSGLVHHDEDGAELGLRLSKTFRNFVSVLGSCFSKTFLPAGVSPCP
jgi:hypothetical protein